MHKENILPHFSVSFDLQSALCTLSYWRMLGGILARVKRAVPPMGQMSLGSIGIP